MEYTVQSLEYRMLPRDGVHIVEVAKWFAKKAPPSCSRLLTLG